MSEDSKSGVGIELIVLKERILYTGLFLPHLIFCLLHSCKQFCSILNLLRYNCVKRKITLELEFAHSLAEKSKWGKNQTGVNISLYTVFLWEKKVGFDLVFARHYNALIPFRFLFYLVQKMYMWVIFP